MAGLIATRRISATEAVKAHIDRIQAMDSKLHAVVVPLFEEARGEAARADNSSAEGRPLHGVPVTVKECFDVRGTPSTVGMGLRRGHRAAEDAELVARLRAAGAIVVGKTNVPQLLIYVEADNPVYGRTNNPWNLERSPGGSSGGEGAAVAAGYSCLGLGTDFGGSVRIPAHCCGVQSLKPTPDRLSLKGTVDSEIFAGSPIPDAAGPIARTVADLRLAMSALGSPVAETSIKGLRVGFYEDDGYFPASPAIRRAVREASEALEAAGCQVSRFAPPDIGECLSIFYGLATVRGGDEFKALIGDSPRDPRISDLFTLAGLAGPLRPPVAALYGLRGQKRVADLVGWSGRKSEAGAADLLARFAAYRKRFSDAMGDLDALICPPCSVPGFTHGATRQLGPASVCYTVLFNFLAWPAGVVAASRVRKDEQQSRPASRDEIDDTARKVDAGSAGLPVGVQVAGRAGRDDIVLAVMDELEARFRERTDYPATPVG